MHDKTDKTKHFFMVWNVGIATLVLLSLLALFCSNDSGILFISTRSHPCGSYFVCFVLKSTHIVLFWDAQCQCCWGCCSRPQFHVLPISAHCTKTAMALCFGRLTTLTEILTISRSILSILSILAIGVVLCPCFLRSTPFLRVWICHASHSVNCTQPDRFCYQRSSYCNRI